MAMIFRRPDGRLVWVDPGASVPVIEELAPNYGRLLQDVLSGALHPVGCSRPDAQDALVRALRSPSPTSPGCREPSAGPGRLAVVREGTRR